LPTASPLSLPSSWKAQHLITESPITPARRRLAPQERRAEIVEITMRLLAERGYWALTVADVAKEAGMTAPGVMRYFPTKSDLLTAVLEERDRADIMWAAPRTARTSGADEFIGVIGRLIARNAQRPHLIRLYTVLSAESLDPRHPAHEFFAGRLRRATSIIAQLMSAWHPAPDDESILVVCLLDGLQLNWLRDPRIDMQSYWQRWASEHYESFRTASPELGRAGPAIQDLKWDRGVGEAELPPGVARPGVVQ
jgi:AcrR family transcriptional regulator